MQVDVTVVVAVDPEADPEAAERSVWRLRGEIEELDVESVRPVAVGEVPEGAKGGADVVTAGAVIVALSASGGVLPGLVSVVNDWLGRQSARHRVSVTIDGDTIELERASDAERQRLIDAYVRRHNTAR
ncbi:hypothetical protein OG607_21750 [Streptomyces sp. NBC_01537]|uniref:effector-associated constant component EACC1 n=1 Tax=Streptomyces sp. NBC_01537 TaxID=2903896 RepID=UPI003864D336